MWHCNRFFPQYFGSTLSVLFRTLFVIKCRKYQKKERLSPGILKQATSFRMSKSNKCRSFIIQFSWVKLQFNVSIAVAKSVLKFLPTYNKHSFIFPDIFPFCLAERFRTATAHLLFGVFNSQSTTSGPLRPCD